MRAAGLLALAVCLATAAAVPANARSIHAVEHTEHLDTGALGARGAVVRYAGAREILVEADESFSEELVREGHRARPVGRIRADRELFISYPRNSLADLSRVGEVLWSERGGAALVACPEGAEEELRVLSFMSYRLPEAVNVESWFDDTPPGHARARGADDERPVRGVVQDVINSMSSDSLMAHVERLSTYPGGELKSRYALREECIGEGAAYIIDQLNAVLPTRALVDTQRFYLERFTCDEGPDGDQILYPQENIVGVLPGSGRLSGCYIVCAHYDATATNSFGGPYDEPPFYWWCENQAPGADDNATGVATVLETARAISGLTFPFDIRFVLFGAEELGLYGSTAYADSVAGKRVGVPGVSADPDTIYGVLNVDMIAFKPDSTDTDLCHLVTNPGSTWLASWLVDTADTFYGDLFPDFDVVRIDTPFLYSDHAPFWLNDYDAIVALEHYAPRDRNPFYHTIDDHIQVVGDTMPTVYPSQLTAVAKMVAGSVARFAEPDGTFNLSVFSDDIVFYGVLGDGSYYHTDHFVIGEPAPVRVDVHAFGPDESASFEVEIWDGECDEGTLLSSFTASGVMGGGEVISHEFDWDLDDSHLGDHWVNVRVTSEGVDELTLTDNEVRSAMLRVDAPRLFISDHFAWPNPASGPGELHVAYRLSRESIGSVEIKVFDLAGQEVGSTWINYDHSAGDEGNVGLLPGLNSISWASLDTSVADLASGVYVYSISLYDPQLSDPIDQKMGKLALVR